MIQMLPCSLVLKVKGLPQLRSQKISRKQRAGVHRGLDPEADKHMQLLIDNYCITDHDDLDGTEALIEQAREVGVSCDLFSSQPKCFVLHCDLLAVLL